MATVELDGTSKAFDGVEILHPTSLTVDDGEFLVIVGPSGCGKSTLLRMIAGLERPSAGRILIGGRDVTEVAPADRGVAMVFQSYALYPHLTVAGNIGFPLSVKGVPKPMIAQRVREVADLLDLGDLLDRRPRALSGGQRQRVSIGRAIIREPAVLLMDEPLSNLDAALRVRMRHEFARLHQRLGATMVYVTHDQLEAMTLANRIVVMEAGRIEQVGAPLDLYARPASIPVATAIGSPAITLLPVRIAAGGGDRAGVAWNGAACAVGARVPADDVGREATLGLRPEHLRVDADGPFHGRVELFERLGPLSFAHLDTGLVAQLPADRHVALGEVLRLSIDPVDARLFDADGRAYPLIDPPISPPM